jgi:hypothetical protein
MARFPGFIGPAYTLSSPKAECQNCVNLFLEADEAQTGKNGEAARLVSTPGLGLKIAAGTGPIRALWATSIGGFIAVSGSEVYAISSSWVASKMGDLSPNSGLVEIADNGTQALIVDGVYAYVLVLATGALSIVSNTDQVLGVGARCTFLDGYFIIMNTNPGQFQISGLYDGTTWSALDFGTAEGSPDKLVAIRAVNRQLWLFGSKTTEVYYDSGDTFPFVRVDGAFMQYGCAAPFTVQPFAGSAAWLTDAGMVVMTNGYMPRRISNHAIELEIRKSDMSQASAWSYQQDGHYFYCLNLDDSQKTLVYDIAAQSWHERSRLENGQDLRHRANTYAYAYGKHIVGDFQNGNIYEMSFDYKTDNGQPIARERTSPHGYSDGKRLFVSRLLIDCAVGVGLDGIQQGTDPQIMMRISRDGGMTWGNERWKSLGKIGSFKHRVWWDRLGSGRDLVTKVRYTEPTEFTILGASVNMEVGAN